MLKDRLFELQSEIKHLANHYGRDANDIHLLAVSKQQSASAILNLHQQGQIAFGENYCQEALGKIIALPKSIEWHFIGPIQSNKTTLIAQHFAWVHSVDRVKIAERLQRERDASLPPLNICVQVNLEGEATKSGVAPESLLALAKAIHSMDRLRLRGLMCIPKAKEDFLAQRETFAKLRALKDELNHQGFTLDTLSMGMSNDYPAAIAEGSTWLRIGSKLFGQRQ